MEIDKEALELTKQICHCELDNLRSRYHTNHLQVISQFLKKDFCFLLWFSLFGAILIFIPALYFEGAPMLTTIFFFGLLGAFGIWQSIRDDYLQTKDLLTMSYINQGKSFLYYSSLITFFEIMTLIVFMIFLPIGYQDKVGVILCAVFPVFLSQIISLCFIQYISHVIISFVLYFVCYLMTSAFFLLNDFYLLINFSSSIGIIVVIITIYMLSILKVYTYKKRRKETWN